VAARRTTSSLVRDMPSIEVVCIDQASPLQFGTLSFALESETSLRSHRSPHPRFQSDFDLLRGCIYHFGNPEFRSPGTGLYFAYHLLSRACADADSNEFLEFSERFRPDIQVVMKSLVLASPVGRLLFTSDWQFGPEETRRIGLISLAQFWNLHDGKELFLNSSYAIHAA
jgi:hypothetical protein